MSSPPAACRKTVCARCEPLPVPADEKVSLPGCDFTSAMNSCAVVAGTDGCSSSTVGKVAASEIGVKSLKTSYCSRAP